MKGSKFFISKRITLLILIISTSFFIISCSNKNKVNRAKFDPCKSFSFECNKGKQTIVVYSSKGEIVLELYSNHALGMGRMLQQTNLNLVFRTFERN